MVGRAGTGYFDAIEAKSWLKTKGNNWKKPAKEEGQEPLLLKGAELLFFIFRTHRYLAMYSTVRSRRRRRWTLLLNSTTEGC